jgi:hypothetical protein
MTRGGGAVVICAVANEDDTFRAGDIVDQKIDPGLLVRVTREGETNE